MSTDTSFLTPIATGTQRYDLPEDGISITVYPTGLTSWRDTLPNHRDAAVKRCAARRFRRRDAQTTYARLLIEAAHELRKGRDAILTDDVRRDCGEVLEALSIDEARRIAVRDRALAFLADLAVA